MNKKVLRFYRLQSSRSITEQILQHPGEKFDVSPFVDSRCKTPKKKLRRPLMVISRKKGCKAQTVPWSHRRTSKAHSEVEQEILRLSDKYEAALNLIRTVPGSIRIQWLQFRCFQRLVVICLSSPQQNTSSLGLDVVPEMIRATVKSNPLGFPVLVLILNQFWYKLQML